MSNPVYEKMLEELASGELDELQRDIFNLLKTHPEGMTRAELVHGVYDYWPQSLEGNTDDRKIRKAIEKLRERLFPIVSTSSQPGYRLDASREAVEKMIHELQSRRQKIQDQINAAAKFYNIPVEYPEPQNWAQTRLI